MSFPTNIMSAIVTQWTNASLPGTLKFGRQTNVDKPYGVFNWVGDVAANAFSAPKLIDKMIFQLSIFDIDSDNVATVMAAIHTAYHRQTLGISASIVRINSGFSIMPDLDANSNNVYMGFHQFQVIVDN